MQLLAVFGDSPAGNRKIHCFQLDNKLLIGKPSYKAEELMDTFYISRSTLTQDLNRARTLLAKFRLEIDVNLRRGIGVAGDELDKRLCIAEYFFRYDDKLQVMVQRRADGGK